MLSVVDLNKTKFGMKDVFLTFTDQRSEREYRQIVAKSSKRYSQIALLVVAVCAVAYTIGDQLIGSKDTKLMGERLILCGVLAFAALIQFTKYYERNYENIIFGVYFLSFYDDLTVVAYVLRNRGENRK